MSQGGSEQAPCPAGQSRPCSGACRGAGIPSPPCSVVSAARARLCSTADASEPTASHPAFPRAGFWQVRPDVSGREPAAVPARSHVCVSSSQPGERLTALRGQVSPRRDSGTDTGDTACLRLPSLRVTNCFSPAGPSRLTLWRCGAGTRLSPG